MNSFAILLAITLATLVGDYCIKLASLHPHGLTTTTFLVGVMLYGLPAIGWFLLMRNHSLAAIGIYYSAATILLLAAMGYFVFKESFGLREGAGVALATLAVFIMSYGHEHA